MTIPSWTDWTLYHYLAIGGGGLVVLALLLYLTPLSRLKVPSVLLGSIGGLAAGAALGVIAMAYFGYQLERKGEGSADGSGSQLNPMMARGGGGRGGSGGRGGRGGAPASVKPQLEALIGKLDLMSHKPLALTFDAEQKKKMREILDKLDVEKALSEDDAKAKIEGLKKVFNEEQLKTLEAAGYRWPGQGGGGRPPVAPAASSNPFADGENNEHLKSLLGRLEVKKTE